MLARHFQRLAGPARPALASLPKRSAPLALRTMSTTATKNTRSNLEIFKFAVYIFIPIGMFYWFNVPEFQEEYTKDMRERVFGQAVSSEKVPHSLEEAREMRRKLLENKGKPS